MKEAMDKALCFGLGVFSYSKEKVQEIVDDMVQRGTIQKEKAAQVVEDFVQRGEQERQEVDRKLREMIAKHCEPFATKEDVRRIVREELARADRAVAPLPPHSEQEM